MKKSTALRFAVLCGVPFVMVLGNSMLIPIFPQMQTAMNLSPVEVGLIVTFFSLPAGLLIPLAGFLSDQFGRKIIMVPALFLYGLGGLVSGFAALWLTQPFTVLLIGRIVQGIGAGGTYQLAMALTGDIFQSNERTKALGLLEAANGLGKVVSPVLGSVAALVVWFFPFFLYGVLAFPVALGVWFLVKEPEGNTKREPLKQYWHKLVSVFREKTKILLSSYFVGMTALFSLFGVLSWLSDVLETDYGVLGIHKGLLLAIPVTSMAVTSYISGVVLSERVSLWKPAIVGGMVLAAASLLLLPLFADLIAFLAVLFALGVSIGIVLPPINTLITGAAEADKRGVVTSLYGTVRFLGVAMGPPAFGLAIAFGRWPMFIAAALIAAAAAVIGLLCITSPKPQA